MNSDFENNFQTKTSRDDYAPLVPKNRIRDDENKSLCKLIW